MALFNSDDIYDELLDDEEEGVEEEDDEERWPIVGVAMPMGTPESDDVSPRSVACAANSN